MQLKCDGMSNGTFKMVKEDDTCLHWECIGGNVLAPMRECWYCKYSDFRKDISRSLTSSICHCPLNRVSDDKKEL